MFAQIFWIQSLLQINYLKNYGSKLKQINEGK
jgi:hypothetical protein